MYYPFLEQEIVDTLDIIMREAQDYHDFVSRLSQKVCTDDVPDKLTYLAAVHAWNLGSLRIKEELMLKHGNSVTVASWVTEDFNSRTSAIEKALSSDLDGWIAIELHYLNASSPDYADHLSFLPSIDEARELLEIDAQLRCFEPRILTIQGTINRIEGDIHAALLNFEDGMKIATEFDDRVRATDLLFRIGNLKKDISPKESWDIFDKAHRSAISIGYTFGVGRALLDMGKVSYIRGEYDLAISCLLKSDDLFGSALARKEPSVSLQLTRVYCALGIGEEALTWVNTTIDRTQSTITWDHLQKAQSLVLLGKTREALLQLELGKNVAFKEGREWDLAKYYYVNGLYEIAAGNSLNGIMSLEQSMEIIDRINLAIIKGPCLIALTRAEMEVHSISGDSDTSGPWMSRLENYAREKDLPGIIMEHALLKAEFQKRQNRIEAARKTLIEALEIYDSPSVKTLRTRIWERLEELEGIPQ
jgi:tetratricopeptide (TPR) repeat protein